MKRLRDHITDALAHAPDSLVQKTSLAESWLDRAGNGHVTVTAPLLRDTISTACDRVLQEPAGGVDAQISRAEHHL